MEPGEGGGTANNLKPAIGQPLNPGAPQSATDENQSRNRQVSLWYTALLTGVTSAAYMPLAYWGFNGILLSLWVAAIGLALLHEFLLPAGVLISLGILISTRFELPLSSVQRATLESPHASEFAPSDLVIPIASTFGIGIVLAAGVAWLLTTMPQDVQRLLRSIAGADEFTGLQAGQFSLFHLLGLLTVACLAVAPIFYGGLAAGFSKSPLILLGGMLAVYRRYGLAFGMLVILVFGYVYF